MKWPCGKHNGKRIVGVVVRMKVNVLWWTMGFHRWGGTLCIHVGPLHMWVDLNYEW